MVMATTGITPDRPVSRPRHFDRRVILGIALAVLTLVLVVLYSNNSIDTYGVLVATRTLVPGTVIGPGDLAEVQVKLPPTLAREALPGSARDDLVGKTVAQTLYANQPIVRAQAGGEFAIPAGHVALTVAVSAETAAGGRLRPGDQVLVLLTLNKGRPEAQTTVVLERALVYDVGHDERFGTFSATGGAGVTAGQSGTGSGEALTSVTLAVTPDEAIQVARAKWAGELDLALLPAQAPQGQR